MRWRRLAVNVVAGVSALVIALAISSIALLLIGHDPITAYREVFNYGNHPGQIISVINAAVPLYIAALAVAIGFKMGLFNIGVEGQYALAALFAATAGAHVHLPWGPLQILFILLVAMGTGAVWAGVAGVLKVTRGVHEVISTIMLNTIAVGISAYLFLEHFAQPTSATNLTTQTPFLPKNAAMPALVHSSAKIPEPLTSMVFIAAILGVLFYVVVWKTKFGYNLRASGTNFEAARVSGIDPRAMVVKTMLLSGAIAGLVGMTQILSFSHAYTLDFQVGLGFTGIAVALVGRNNPIGAAVAALLFGYLQVSAQILDFNGIPKEVYLIMEGVIILSVVVAYELARRSLERSEVRRAAEATRRLAEASEPLAKVEA
ncbi:MAG TPA: ABC transporter permease [Actinomycetota bacterium]